MDKKIIQFFWKSLTGVIVVCIALFMFLLFFMSTRTNETIYDVGGNYMSAVNEQVQQKFTTIIDMELRQIDNVITYVQQESDEGLIAGLEHSAQIIDLSYLGFLTEDGELKKVYGDQIDIIAGDNMQFGENDSIVTRGTDEKGDAVLVLGRRFESLMADGKNSTAIIAAMPMEQLNDALFLQENADEMYSHIINSEGDFVIRNGDAFRDNYFDRIEGSFESYKGKEPEDYRKELEAAIESG